jgi:hypothetical protein
MLSVYSNQQSILTSTTPTKGNRLSTVDSNLLPAKHVAITFSGSFSPMVETHIYTPDGVYLTGDYNTKYTVENNDATSQLVAPQHLAIDLENTLSNLGIGRGQYKIAYNVLNNSIGEVDSPMLWIKEISPSRTEIRLQLTDNDNSTLTRQFISLYKEWNDSIQSDIYNTYLINFGQNETFQIVDFEFGNAGTVETFKQIPELIVKLYNPLPSDYTEKMQLWISEEITAPVIDSVLVIPKYILVATTKLSGPNFGLDEYEKSSIATEYKSWNDLLGASLTTSQQLIDSYFPSGSLSGIKLNINYRLFDNFVHFSSAAERVENFYYKLQLIEHYTSQINTLSGVIGDVTVSTNLSDLYTKRNAVVSGFDDFEKYLFFESTGSSLYSNYDMSGSINPWPKTAVTSLTWIDAYGLWYSTVTEWSVGVLNTTDPYGYFEIQAATDSVEGLEYYNNLLTAAKDYDSTNIHKLQNSVPTYILEQEADTGSDELSLFVHMLGQHFDILWTYIKNLSTINTREEHPKDGMPNELLSNVANSLGFPLLNGKSTSDLWNYALGLNSNGSAIQSDVDGIISIPDSENTKEIWRRIVNNLPYILKSKGTSRSIKALLTCFGIPSTTFTIKEFGGPTTYADNGVYPEYVHDVYHTAVDTSISGLTFGGYSFDNGHGSIVAPNTLEFRFRLNPTYPLTVGSQCIIFSETNTINNGSFTFINNNGVTGTLIYTIQGHSTSISNIYALDNSWHSVVIERTAGLCTLRVAKSLYGNLVYLYSSSIGATIPYGLDSIFSFAHDSPKFYGNIHEIRLWSGSLNNDTIAEHAASPSTYTFNVDKSLYRAGEEASKPYYHLLQRFSLGAGVTSGSLYPSTTNFLKSIHPNQTINTTNPISLVTTSASIALVGFEETYYTPAPSLGASSTNTNKVRIDSSSLDPTKRLNTQTRIEKSSLDKYSSDSNRLGIYFSPQNAINEDIYNQLGYFEIDNFIGDPNDVYNEEYSDLKNFSKNYWKKYSGKNDFESYFRSIAHYDFTLFTYIKRLLPHRVDLLSGLVIEPTVLERSKVRMFKRPSISELKYDANITETDTNPETSADFDNVGLGLIDTENDTIDKLGSNWVQHRYVGKYKLTESGSYRPLQTTVLQSITSNHLMTAEYFYSTAQSASMNLPYSSSLVPAEINKFFGTGYENSRYNGSKLSGNAINVDSVYTIDGGPVVKVTSVNPNQLVFSSNQITTVDQAVTGTRHKSH